MAMYGYVGLCIAMYGCVGPCIAVREMSYPKHLKTISGAPNDINNINENNFNSEFYIRKYFRKFKETYSQRKQELKKYIIQD